MSSSEDESDNDGIREYRYGRLPKYEKRKESQIRLDKKNDYKKFSVKKGIKKRIKCPLCRFSDDPKIAPVMNEFTKTSLEQLRTKPRPVAYEYIANYFNKVCVESDRINGKTAGLKKITSSHVRRHYSEIKYMNKLFFLAVDDQFEFLLDSMCHLAKQGCWKREVKKNCDDRIMKGALQPDKENFNLYLKLSEQFLKLSRARERDVSLLPLVPRSNIAEFQKRHAF